MCVTVFVSVCACLCVYVCVCECVCGGQERVEDLVSNTGFEMTEGFSSGNAY